MRKREVREKERQREIEREKETERKRQRIYSGRLFTLDCKIFPNRLSIYLSV